MRSFPIVASRLALMCASLAACGGALPGVPRAPSARLERRDFIVWHSLRHVLAQDIAKAPEVAAVCVGWGADGSGVLPVGVLQDFSDVQPPVVSGTRCSEGVEPGWELSGASGAPAAYLSFFDVNDSPSAMTVRVRIEMPGRAPEVRTCAVEVVGVAVRRRIGEPPPSPESLPTPPPPRVLGC